jgi:protein arginine N-methyltransferase 1
MSCIKPSVLAEPLVDVCQKLSINSSHCKIFEIDLYTVKKEELDFSSSYELTFIRNDTVHGLIAWFDIYFDKLPNKVEFTTSPYNKSTHWKQTIFYTDFDLFVEKGNNFNNKYIGEIIKGSIAVRKSNTNFRNIDVKVSYHFNGRYGSKDWYQLYKIR